MMRRTTTSGSDACAATPSKPRADQPTTRNPAAAAARWTNGLTIPTGARNQRGTWPVRSRRTSLHPPISRRRRSGPKRQNDAWRWWNVWLPKPCPRRTISAIRSGCVRARSPRTKNVARAPWASSRSSKRGVSAGSGPSSIVNQTSGRLVDGNPVTTGPKIWLLGRRVAYSKTAWVTAITANASHPAASERCHASGTNSGTATPSTVKSSARLDTVRRPYSVAASLQPRFTGPGLDSPDAESSPAQDLQGGGGIFFRHDQRHPDTHVEHLEHLLFRHGAAFLHDGA